MAAALIPYVLPAVLGGALGSAQARGAHGKDARFGGFLKGAAAGAATAYGANKAGANPFGMFGQGAGAGAGGGQLPFNPMSFFNQDSQRIDPEQQDLQPLMQPQVNYLPTMSYGGGNSYGY